jgi:hypothetical protein
MPLPKNNIEFNKLNNRSVVGNFNGGRITPDAGAHILREIDKKLNITKGFSDCFSDFRDPKKCDHTLDELIRQRVYALALGYEDLNDHDRLRSDWNLAVLCEKDDPTGMNRCKESDKGNPLAGKSTLNRLELTPWDTDGNHRYKRTVIHPDQVDDLFIQVFLKSQQEIPQQIIIDLDVTEDEIHGNQEGRFFHAYYKCYCYLPLYIFCGDDLLVARLRRANIDPADCIEDELKRIIPEIRKRWPKVKIIIRADSGFCRDHIMTWCEFNQVDYIIGLPKNNRLIKNIREDLVDAEIRYRQTGKPARIFDDFEYETLDTWSQKRRVISKAEFISKGANPRFVVTSLRDPKMDAQELYQKMYCARGNMENRIKEQQLDLFADRTSTSEMKSNQTRLYFSSIAYVLMNALRRFGLKNTELSNAQCGTIRNKILKIAGYVEITVRKVWISFTECYPFKELFYQVLNNIRLLPEFA